MRPRMRRFDVPASGNQAKADGLSLASWSNGGGRVARNGVVVSRTTLSHVLDSLGPETLTLLTGPSTVEVAAARIYDPEDRATATGEILLAVNVAAAGAADVVAAAAEAEATAIALKGDAASLKSAVAAARRAGITLVAASPAVAWDQLYALIRNVLASPPTDPETAPVGDLFALANAIASLVGGAVAIEDPGSYLLAYSTLDQPIDDARRQTILGRRNPSLWAQRLQDGGFPERLMRSTDVISIVDPEGVARSRIAT